MSQDLNAVDIDVDLLCNLGYENLISFVNTNFKNLDIMLRALSYFIEAIEINSGHYKAHLGLGILLLSGSLYEESLGFLQNAYDLKPSEEIELYIKIAENAAYESKKNKSTNIVTKKKATVDDLLDLGNKFKKF